MSRTRTTRLIAAVIDAAHQTGVDGTIDEPDDAVVASQEVGGEIGHAGLVAVAGDRQQQLVLCGGDTHRFRLLLAPGEEPAQPVAEGQ